MLDANSMMKLLGSLSSEAPKSNRLFSSCIWTRSWRRKEFISTHESTGSPIKSFHMNKVGDYVMSRQHEAKDFQYAVQNILVLINLEFEEKGRIVPGSYQGDCEVDTPHSIHQLYIYYLSSPNPELEIHQVPTHQSHQGKGAPSNQVTKNVATSEHTSRHCVNNDDVYAKAIKEENR